MFFFKPISIVNMAWSSGIGISGLIYVVLLPSRPSSPYPDPSPEPLLHLFYT